MSIPVLNNVKRIVRQKLIPPFTHPDVLPDFLDFLSSVEHIFWRIFLSILLVNRVQSNMVQKILFFFLFFSHKYLLIQDWNDMRVSKWWQPIFFTLHHFLYSRPINIIQNNKVYMALQYVLVIIKIVIFSVQQQVVFEHPVTWLNLPTVQVEPHHGMFRHLGYSCNWSWPLGRLVFIPIRTGLVYHGEVG